jgi:hypothetical protein
MVSEVMVVVGVEAFIFYPVTSGKGWTFPRSIKVETQTAGLKMPDIN